MCAGVQKLSLPIDRCHDTSQMPPTVEQVTAAAPIQIVHGTPAATRARTPGLSAARTGPAAVLTVFAAVDIDPLDALPA